MFLNFLFLKYQGERILDVPAKYHSLIVLRGVIGYFALQGYWAAIMYMPIALVNCIINLAPVFTSVAAWMVMDEKLTKFDFLAIVVSFIGVVVINNPF